MKRNASYLPAILGGEKAVTKDHTSVTQWPVLTAEDEQAVLSVMRDGNISTHPVIRDLEKDYASLTNRRYALAHNNGTAALLAAFFSIGLQPGDEVLVPSATFWASVLPMLWVGAVPVFCESETQRMGIDPEDLERKITAKTRAIVVVHLWGLPCKMSRIFDIAARHNLKIIEDASHAHGACWRGRPAGSLGDVSVFSLQGDKLSPAGEGGMLLCDESCYFEKAACLGDITRINELPSPARRFAATGFGMKTRIAPVSAAIARGQVQRLASANAQRNKNLVYLSRKLEGLGFDTFMPPDYIQRVYFEYLIRYNPGICSLTAEKFCRVLALEGCHVQTPRYPLLHQQPFFTEGAFRQILRPDPSMLSRPYGQVSLPRTESANQWLFRLPAFPGKDNGILDQYIQAFEKVIRYAEKIEKAIS
jgi:perosamine synthetase